MCINWRTGSEFSAVYQSNVSIVHNGFSDIAREGSTYEKLAIRAFVSSHRRGLCEQGDRLVFWSKPSKRRSKRRLQFSDVDGRLVSRLQVHHLWSVQSLLLRVTLSFPIPHPRVDPSGKHSQWTSQSIQHFERLTARQRQLGMGHCSAFLCATDLLCLPEFSCLKDASSPGHVSGC